MPFDPKDVRNVAIALALGGIAGAAVILSHHDEKRKSQAEKDDPDRAEWICGLVWDLLDGWEPPDFEREDEYTDDLAQFLREELRSEHFGARLVTYDEEFRKAPKQELIFPIRATQFDLRIPSPKPRSSDIFFLLDPTQMHDVVDYWNLRAAGF